jgi:hypothetical protein
METTEINGWGYGIKDGGFIDGNGECSYTYDGDGFGTHDCEADQGGEGWGHGDISDHITGYGCGCGFHNGDGFGFHYEEQPSEW